MQARALSGATLATLRPHSRRNAQRSVCETAPARPIGLSIAIRFSIWRPRERNSLKSPSVESVRIALHLSGRAFPLTSHVCVLSFSFSQARNLEFFNRISGSRNFNARGYINNVADDEKFVYISRDVRAYSLEFFLIYAHYFSSEFLLPSPLVFFFLR